MSEGKKVNVAFKGPDVEHDKLISFIEARNREDHQRSSSAGESRQKIAEFLEDTGCNSQALSWARSILKKLDKTDGQHKAMDVIMSLKKVLPMIEAHVTGQSTPDMFPDEVASFEPDDELDEYQAANREMSEEEVEDMADAMDAAFGDEAA